MEHQAGIMHRQRQGHECKYCSIDHTGGSRISCSLVYVSSADCYKNHRSKQVIGHYSRLA